MSMNNGFFEMVVDGPLQDTIDQSYHSAPIIILAANTSDHRFIPVTHVYLNNVLLLTLDNNHSMFVFAK